jgi:hypothetical protein
MVNEVSKYFRKPTVRTSIKKVSLETLEEGINASRITIRKLKSSAQLKIAKRKECHHLDYEDQASRLWSTVAPFLCEGTSAAAKERFDQSYESFNAFRAYGEFNLMHSISFHLNSRYLYRRYPMARNSPSQLRVRRRDLQGADSS